MADQISRFRADLNAKSAHRNLSGVGLGFAKTGDAIAFLPLAALLEQADPLKTLQNIPFSTYGGDCAQTAML
jgi:hypothetical protein